MRTRIVAVGLAVGALVALGGASSSLSAQDADQNKALFSVVVNQIYNGGNLALADELVAKDVTSNGAALGRDGFKAMVKEMRAKAPDRKFQVDELVADGDRVIGRVTQTGAPGEPGSEILVFRIKDGLVAEQWHMTDEPAIRRQFGLRATNTAPSSSAN